MINYEDYPDDDEFWDELFRQIEEEIRQQQEEDLSDEIIPPLKIPNKDTID